MKNLIFSLGLIFFNIDSHALENSSIPSSVEQKTVNSFLIIWENIKNASPELQSIQSKLNVQQFKEKRIQNHYFPQLSLTGSVTNSNQPSQVFFSKLSQRKIENSDFSPSLLNHPPSELFKNLRLSVALPLYEGGIKEAEKKLNQNLSEAQQYELQSRRLEIFSDSVSEYSKIISIQNLLKKHLALKETLNQILSQYKIGGTSNPVGYSGLLALKGVLLRIESNLLDLTSEKDLSVNWLMRMSQAPFEVNKIPEITVKTFVDTIYSFDNKNQYDEDSLFEKRAKKISDSSLYQIEMSKALYLPKVSLIANEDLMSGQRSSAFSYTFGLFAEWSFFNPSSLYQKEEAIENHNYLRKMSESVSLSKMVQIEKLNLQNNSLEKKKDLLIQNEKILNEQSKIAFKLFRSGNLSAIQLSEILNHQMDLLQNMKNCEFQWILIKSEKVKYASVWGESL